MTRNEDPSAAKTILVVDDDADVREVLEIVLEEAGYAVVSAVHGADALDKLQQGLTPSLVILDLMMPVMSGWDFWDEVHASPRFRGLPIVVLTASGLTQGCLGDALVLPKPVSHDQLLHAVAHHAAAA